MLFRDSRRIYATIATLLLVVFAGAALVFIKTIKVEEREYLVQNDAVARSLAASIEAREEGYLNVLRAYAGRFRFREAIERRNLEEASIHLRQFRQAFPELNAVFLADPTGIVWVTEPKTPEIYGRNYAFRDWYRGVSASWQPYMSEVYQTDIGHVLAVALAVPIHDVDGRVLGIIAAVQRLETLREWLLPIQIEGGDVYVVDRKGQLVFHRTRVGAEHLADYIGVPTVRRLLAGESGTAALENSVDGVVSLAAYRRIHSLGWGVVVRRPNNVLLQRMRTLIVVSGGIGFALAATVAVLGWLALRNERRIGAALARSSERLTLLHEIDRAMMAATAPAKIAEAVLPRLRDLLDVPRAIVNLFDLEAGEAEWLAGIGRRQLRVGPGVRFPLRLMGDLESLQRGHPQLIETAALPRDAHTEPLRASGVDTYMVVPMIATGKLIGAVSFGGSASTFSAEQISIAQEVAAQLAIALEQARLLERVQRQAEELEHRVETRTLALQSANEQLEREIEERRRAEMEAERANLAKSEFLSRMSHELRTPLNGIIGFAQLLEYDQLSPEQRESVSHIVKGGRHLLHLINEVLDIARIEAGNLAISLEPVLVTEVLRSAMDLVRPQAANRRITVAEIAPTDRYVLADRQRLQQVLLNLLSNAIKYNTDGGTIRLVCDDAPRDRVRLSVIDTGRGIEPQMMDRLFRPFDRLGAERTEIEGTGLGLALSHRLVAAMGGTLSATSMIGQGTALTVELATVPPPAPALKEDVHRVQARDDRVFGIQGTILYIEDNVANVRLFERIIAHRPGVTLLSAIQGRRGLELARDHHPHLILLDMHLPDLPGADVLTELHADPATQRIPVVILSADATPGLMARLLERGATAYLTKPVDVTELLTLVDRLLTNHPNPP